MNPIWIIAKKELKTFFDGLIAYILLAGFLGICGFFTWFSTTDIFSMNQATLTVFFKFWAYWLLILLIPALSMRMIAEERKAGTIELLLTKAVSDWQLVMGKFLACFMLILIALAFTLPYYITIANIGIVDHGEILAGYLGLLLMSAFYISVGIYASSITDNQIVAFLLTLFIAVFFHFLFGLIARNMPGTLGAIFNWLSLENHFESISRGVLDSRDLLYFLSFTLIGLSLAERSLSSRNSR